jgi:hypothetical protein
MIWIESPETARFEIQYPISSDAVHGPTAINLPDELIGIHPRILSSPSLSGSRDPAQRERGRRTHR